VTDVLTSVSGHVPVCADNNRYVNLSGPGDSPTAPPAPGADVRTPDVRTPLPQLLGPYHPSPEQVAALRQTLERQRADRRTEVDDLRAARAEAERLRGLLRQALDGWGDQGDYGDDPHDTIARIRREADLDVSLPTTGC
jgi:hypothetical protein